MGRPADPRLGRARRTGQGPGLAAARLRGGPQGGARLAAQDRRCPLRPRGRRLPGPLQGTGGAALPGRGRRSARRGPQPGLLRGDRRPRTALPRRRLRLGGPGGALQRRRRVPDRARRGHVLRPGDGVHGRRRGGGGHRRHRTRRAPRNPRALAEACVALLRDPERRERLGAAARARALELFTVEQNITAFHGIYLEILSRAPVRRVVLDGAGEPLPFGVPAEAHVPGRWSDATARAAARGGPGAVRTGPGWATGGGPVRATTAVSAAEGASR